MFFEILTIVFSWILVFLTIVFLSPWFIAYPVSRIIEFFKKSEITERGSKIMCFCLFFTIFAFCAVNLCNDLSPYIAPTDESGSFESSITNSETFSSPSSLSSSDIQHTPSNGLPSVNSSQSNHSSFSSETSSAPLTDDITGPLSTPAWWTEGGHSYHFSPSCPSLSRSSSVQSGTLSDALDAGKYDPCNICAYG